MDARVLHGAQDLHLPQDPAELRRMSGSTDVAPTAAALVRVTIDSELRAAVLADHA